MTSLKYNINKGDQEIWYELTGYFLLSPVNLVHLVQRSYKHF